MLAGAKVFLITSGEVLLDKVNMENESKFNLKMAHFMCQFVSRYDFNGICSIVISLQVEQIQAEYKKLALELHPDKNSGDKEAEAKFQQIQVL